MYIKAEAGSRVLSGLLKMHLYSDNFFLCRLSDPD